VPGDIDGALHMDALARSLDGARMLVVNAGSNVLGTTLDTDAMTRMAHDAGALVLVDTAQTAGHIPFDAAAVGADLIAFTGHKAMLGPQGTGGLWVRPGVDVAPLLSGGTGGNSLDREMPAAWPDHLEAGTTNAPGIAGLSAGVDWVLGKTVETLRRHASALKTRLWDGLSTIEGLRVLSPRAPAGVPIVTVIAKDIDPAAFASRLDREHGILTRPGLHCAPEVHRLLGTDATGAVRFSLGWSSTEEDVDRAIESAAVLTRSTIVAVGG
jgi:selenocysteine lyase/cysteine desulfurase